MPSSSVKTWVTQSNSINHLHGDRVLARSASSILLAALLPFSALADGGGEIGLRFAAEPAESPDAFVVRISPAALEATHARDAEFCGVIGVGPDGNYSLNLVTSGRPWTCTIPASSLVEGHSWTGLIFHTHTLRGADGWANADLARPGYLATKRKVLFQDRNKMRKLAEYQSK